MELTKRELLEILIEVIKHNYSLESLGNILEIIQAYDPLQEKPNVHYSESLLVSDEEDEEDDDDEDESTVAIFLSEGSDE